MHQRECLLPNVNVTSTSHTIEIIAFLEFLFKRRCYVVGRGGDFVMCQPATNSVASKPHEFLVAQEERLRVPRHVLLIAPRRRPND